MEVKKGGLLFLLADVEQIRIADGPEDNGRVIGEDPASQQADGRENDELFHGSWMVTRNPHTPG